MNPLNHVAIIMDGNGRWGLKNKKNRNVGHKEGLKVLEKIFQKQLKKNKIFNIICFFYRKLEKTQGRN
jgi:undecaprenyl diphosphate synthase